MRTGADVVVETLEALGVEHIFGIPGDMTILFNRLRKSPIRFFTTRHEQVAAFMADGYGRFSGKPGVCFATLGPGAANLVTGVANAFQDRSPVVVLSDQVPTNEFHPDSHQYVDLAAMFRPITKWSVTVEKPEDIPAVLQKAFAIAAEERPGPVYVALPDNVLEAGTTVTAPVRAEKKKDQPFSVKNAADLMNESAFPLIVVGDSVARTGAVQAFQEFVHACRFPVVTTFHGKGIISDNDPLVLGVLSRHAASLRQVLEKVDLLVMVGYDFIEGIKPDVWNIGGGKKIVSIDSVANTAPQFFRPDCEVVGDIASILRALEQQVRPKAIEVKKPALSAREGQFAPQRIVQAIRDALGEDDILVSDVGLHKQHFGLFYKTYKPKTAIFSNGLSSMGFSFPVAMAAKLLHPEKKVLFAAGDGGFLMNVQDLETCKRYNIPVVGVILVDASYGMIKFRQMKRFGEHYAVEFSNPDFLALVKSFGIDAYAASSAEDLKKILAHAFAANKPAIVTIRIDYDYARGVS